MSDSPQRRSRRPPNRSGGGALPFVPIFIGVIILGFVIGAGLSLLGRSGQQAPVAATSPTFSAEPVTPAPADSRAASLAEAPSPEPARTARPTPSAKAESATPAAATSPGTETAAPDTSSASASPAAADASPRATAKPAATHVPVVPPPPPPIAQATRAAEAAADEAAAPSPERTRAAPFATASGDATATSAPPVSDDADTAFGKLAAGVVRGYLDAVARGDTDAAYSALGNAPGGSSGELSEQGIVTPATRIKHVEARGTEDAATVNVDLATPSGSYFGQYTVHRVRSGAAVIVQHTIFKS